MQTDEDEEQTKFDHRKIWGAGYHAGLKARGKLDMEGSQMNQSKAISKLNNLSPIEKRVFEAVPIQTPQTMHQISSEYARLNSVNLTTEKLERCLRRIVEAGLVKNTNGRFYRDALERETLTKNTKPKLVTAPTPEPPAMKVISSSVPALKNNSVEQLFAHVDQLRELLAQIESDVIAVDEYVKSKAADFEKLDQLKTLLVSLK